MKEGLMKQATGWGQCFELPSVLWHCWLGDRWPQKSVPNGDEWNRFLRKKWSKKPKRDWL